MIDIVKRIGEFSKEYNRIVEMFHRITPTSIRMEETYKPFNCFERELYDEDGCWVEDEVEYNTGADIINEDYTFPNYTDFEEKAEIFYKDCDYLILKAKDDILISFSKAFNYPQIYPTAEQFSNAQMYNEAILLDIIFDVWGIVKDYKEGHGIFYDAIEERRKKLMQGSEQKIAKNPVMPKQERNTHIPAELNNGRAKALLHKAKKANFFDEHFNWLKTKALLAYFADRASEYLKLGKGEYDGNAKTSWKPFEILFGVSGLSGAKRDYQNTGTLPIGYADVDKLFE